MKMKSYFADSVESAVKKAGDELGPDAMLVSTRRAGADAKDLGAYEVVFALAAPAAPLLDEDTDRPAVATRPDPSETDSRKSLSEELGELRKQLEGMRRALTRATAYSRDWAICSPDVEEIFSSLLGARMDEELAQEVVEALAIRLQGNPVDREGIERLLTEALENRFSVDATLEGRDGCPRVVALVGPPGSGKTTTLVKLAVAYGLTMRRPVQLLSLDTYRVAAVEQLRTYAGILGVGFQALETTGALAQAIEEHCHKDLILVDTPGYSAGDFDAATEMAPFFAAHPEVDTHLVLTASMNSADLVHVAERYECFRPSKLLFTKLDETETLGPLYSEAVRTGKPISFLTTGQRIPEDLEEATKSRLIGQLLPGRLEKARSAA